MRNVSTEEFNRLINSKINMIAKLFLEKNNAYKTNDDPMANFTTGGMLRHGRGDFPGKYEALKDYLGKHIAHLYNNNIDGPKLTESWRDLAVYSIIAMVMCEIHVTEKGIQGASCDKMFMDEQAAYKPFKIGDCVKITSNGVYKDKVGTIVGMSKKDKQAVYITFDGPLEPATNKLANGNRTVELPTTTVFWLSELELIKAKGICPGDRVRVVSDNIYSRRTGKVLDTFAVSGTDKTELIKVLLDGPNGANSDCITPPIVFYGSELEILEIE